jgi:hypothetical protein
VRSVLLLALLGASACFDDALVLGDETAMRACAAAERVVAPPAGCTTLRVVSDGPYGCLFPGATHPTAGSWVRVAGTAGVTTVDVHLVTPPSSCLPDDPVDGSALACAPSVLATLTEFAPCDCSAPYDSPPATLGGDVRITLAGAETQLFLQPFGGTFDVTVCAGP